VQARSQAEAFAVRVRLRDELLPSLEPGLARAFDELVSGDEVVHLPRLELRLQVASLEELSTVLPELVYRQARAKLREFLGEVPLVHAPIDGKRVPARQDRFESLLHYLKSGSLRWPVDGTDNATIAEWLRPAHAEEAVALCRAGLEATELRERVGWYFRLLQLSPESEWGAMVRASVSVRRGTDLLEALAALFGGDGGAVTRYRRLHLAAIGLAAMTLEGNPAMSADVAAILFDALDGAGGRATDAEVPSTPAEGESPHPALARISILPVGARAFFRRLLMPESGREDRETRANGAVASESFANTRPASAANAPRESSDPFGIAASHVGLTLLHPFLPLFFEATEVKPLDRPELSARSLPRAAALLAFLATGEEESHEYEIGFIKLLLGLTLETPLPIAAGLLTRADRDEADGLLRAVIDHWSALKSTSVDGLRASFLQRRGLLRAEEQGWRLRIESAPFDVLLGQLPWGIGIIKLPWMEKPIFTEWPAH
jgi:hypothetical protein